VRRQWARAAGPDARHVVRVRAGQIQDRVRAGLPKARADGKTLGRPKVNEKTEAAIRAKLKDGVGMTARELGMEVSTAVWVKADSEKAA
jgi:DNA invertase Pin-like site-specific DNA recombinase